MRLNLDYVVSCNMDLFNRLKCTHTFIGVGCYYKYTKKIDYEDR